MPDFLSRLVERTFGLVKVAQPVSGNVFAPRHPVEPITGSIFAPRPSVEIDHLRGLALDSESVIKQDGVHINNPLRTKSIPQQDNQPELNQKKQFDKEVMRPSDLIEELDLQTDFTFTLRQPHDNEQLNESLKQDSSGSSQIKSTSLRRISEQGDQYSHTSPAELAQDNNPFYKVDLDALESVESEPLHSKIDFDNLESLGNEQTYLQKRNDRSVLPQIPKSILIEEQSHAGRKNSQAHIDPFVNSVFISVSNEDSFVSKTMLKSLSDSSLTSISSSSLKSREPILLNSKPDYSEDFFPPGRLHSDVQSSPGIPSRQNLNQASTLKANAALEQMGNMLIKHHAVATRSPSTVPTVKVTIGRIEVRAVNPPQAPQPQTPPTREKPIISLDDYLKQHNG